jgi:hypothetical protein
MATCQQRQSLRTKLARRFQILRKILFGVVQVRIVLLEKFMHLKPGFKSVVLANSELIDKVGFVLIPSILAGESIVSHLRVTIGGVPQSCRSPV